MNVEDIGLSHKNKLKIREKKQFYATARAIFLRFWHAAANLKTTAAIPANGWMVRNCVLYVAAEEPPVHELTGVHC